MEDKVCLDTDILVNFLRNKKEEVDFVVQNEPSVLFAATDITLFELYYGAYKSGSAGNIVKVRELQQRVKILHLSPEAARKAGQTLANLERKGELIDFRDLLIGCISATEGFSLKTNNKKHLARIPDLVLRE